MLDNLRRILARANPAATGGNHPEPFALAVTALLFHAAALDGSIDTEEERLIASLVRRRFDLDEDALPALIAAGRATEEETHQILGFTRDIKDSSNHKDRIELMEMLWEVVLADGEEHAFETNLMRRLAGLIYVTDQESGAARQRVRARMGLV